jgi:hypothetical protein
VKPADWPPLRVVGRQSRARNDEAASLQLLNAVPVTTQVPPLSELH